MRNWHSLYEILRFPIGLLFMGLFLLGLGNLVSNAAFATLFTVSNTFILRLAEVCTRIGTFLIVYFPLYFLIRAVTRKAGSATTVLSAISGYVSYLVMTMCFAPSGLPSTAFSSILGITTSNINVTGAAGTYRYPLQTGVVATIIVAAITLACYRHTRHHSEYGFFGYISKDSWCVFITVIYCGLAGFLMSYVWPFVIQLIMAQMDFIAADTTNPVNLIFYGILDRLLNVLNLSNILRTPFWYGTNGGSWINLSGISVAGDVTIWTSQLAASALTGMAGRFITPYYVLNLFAIPGLLWAMYTLRTDPMEKRRMFMFYVLATLLSWMSGSLLPIEITILLLSPLLFVFHLMYSGLLFGVLQIMKVYLGFNYTGTGTIAVNPGTLPELLTYMRNPSLQQSIMMVMVVGAVSFVIYFLVTRFYFRHLAIDLFRTGEKNRVIDATIDAVGGVENIKLVHSSITRLTLSLYDPSKLNVNALRQLGSIRITETRAGYAISFGAASTMLRIGIMQKMRETIRAV